MKRRWDFVSGTSSHLVHELSQDRTERSAPCREPRRKGLDCEGLSMLCQEHGLGRPGRSPFNPDEVHQSQRVAHAAAFKPGVSGCWECIWEHLGGKPLALVHVQGSGWLGCVQLHLLWHSLLTQHRQASAQNTRSPFLPLSRAPECCRTAGLFPPCVPGQPVSPLQGCFSQS